MKTRVWLVAWQGEVARGLWLQEKVNHKAVS